MIDRRHINTKGVDTIDAEIAHAMNRSRDAQRSWSRSSIVARRSLLRKLRHAIALNSIELAEASAAPRSRPTVEALTAEVLPLLEACMFLEREMEAILATKRVGARHRPIWLKGVRSIIKREPYGVVLIIGPGNYPLLLPGIQMLQAIAAGNSVLLKPGRGGKTAAARLIAMMLEAGFDPDLCVLLPETTNAAIAAMDLKPDKVIFTGSSATGQRILYRLAERLIPSTMELSGCDATIICEDADLELAADAIAFGLTLNDGATCMAPRRVFVNASVAKKFELKLITKLQARLRDDSYFRSNAIGSDTTDLPWELTASILRAIAEGAEIIHGSIRREGAHCYPVVLANVHHDAELLLQDHFAPLVSMVSVESDERAVELTNNHELGLGASIFTGDDRNADRVAAALNVGVVCINDLIIPTADPRLPLSGRKQSGFGSTQGAEGLLEMTVPKVISVNKKKLRRAFARIRENDGELIAAFARLKHLRGIAPRLAAMQTLIDQLRKYTSPDR